MWWTIQLKKVLKRNSRVQSILTFETMKLICQNVRGISVLYYNKFERLHVWHS